MRRKREQPLFWQDLILPLIIVAIVIVLAVAYGCAWLPGPPDPQPTPTPTPTPPPPDNCPFNGSPETEPSWPWCSEVGQKCSSPEMPCKTNPSEDPYYCEEAIPCPVQPPPPDPGLCSMPPNEPVSSWKAWTPGQKPTKYYDEYRKAVAEVGDRCGARPLDTLELIAGELRRTGTCAVQRDDAVMIKREADGMFEEWHAVYFGNGCIIDGSNAHKGTWQHLDSQPPPPSGCPFPHPDPYKMKFNLHKYQGKWDSTYTTVMQCEYCESIGMGEFNGQIRCGCPIRPEGHPDRWGCERYFIGNQQWWCDGVKISHSGNPAQAVCTGHVKTCTEDGVTCAEGDW